MKTRFFRVILFPLVFLAIQCSAVAQDRPGKELLSAVRDGRARKVAALIRSGANVNTEDKKGWTPLILAADNKNLEIVQMLLNARADVKATVKTNHWTALFAAVGYDEDADLVRLLIFAGADLNAQTFDGWTPLMRAIYTTCPKIVRLLIDSRANMNLRNGDGDTALTIARQYHHDDMVPLLTAAGATK